MNNFNCSGKLTRNAVVKGDGNKVLLFTVAASNEFSERVDFIPCTLFNADAGWEVVKLLTEKGKGLEVEFEGYISTSKVQQNGNTRYFTRAVVNPDSLTVIS